GVDVAILAPERATLRRSFAHQHGATALDRDLHQSSGSGEADPLAVGLEEGIEGTFGAREDCGLRLVQESRGQKGPAQAAHRIDNTLAVWRNGSGQLNAGGGIRSKIDGEALQRTFDRSGGAPEICAGNRGGDDGGERERPPRRAATNGCSG